jgi:hypothetical protein
MRFSLKWLLAVMAYVALAIVAVCSHSLHFAHALWLISFAAVVYAFALATAVPGAARTSAIGFLAGAVIYLAVLWTLPDSVLPSYELAEFLQHASFNRRLAEANAAGRSISRNDYVNAHVAGWALNAASTLLAGLIGAALGALAARQVKPIRIPGDRP